MVKRPTSTVEGFVLRADLGSSARRARTVRASLVMDYNASRLDVMIWFKMEKRPISIVGESVTHVQKALDVRVVHEIASAGSAIVTSVYPSCVLISSWTEERPM